MNFEAYGNLKKEYNLVNDNTFKITSISKYFIIINDRNKLIELIKILETEKIKYLVLGGGSNIILPSYYDGVIIKLDLKEVSIIDDKIKVESGYYLNKLAIETVNLGLKGLQWASGIPGQIGGSIVSNAGAHNYEIMQFVEKLEVLENNQIKIINKEDIEYSYRNTNLKGKIVLKAYLKLSHGNKEELLAEVKENTLRRTKTQPLEYPSVGSVFRNPPNNYAGKLIEDAGLKGYRIGGAEVSQKHANFIINKDNATSEDIIKLINHVHAQVLKIYNIDLTIEPEIVLK